MNLLVSIEHAMGWGDFIQRLISSLNYIQYVKTNFKDVRISFVIYEKSTNFLCKALNMEFFHNFVDEFEIRNDYYIFENFACEYKGRQYKRLYSIFNHRGIEAKSPGFWDVHAEQDCYDKLSQCNTNAHAFGYRNISEGQAVVQDHKFPIFNEHLYNEAMSFIHDKFNGPFESIFYRSSSVPDIAFIEKYAHHLKNNIDQSKKYFICSNVMDSKDIIQRAGFNLEMIRPNVTHNNNYTFGITSIDEKIYPFLVTETVILSKSSKIHYCGDHYVVSVFNWYPVLVKNVNLINYDPILR